VRNSEIAKVFSDIGDLLELKGESQFKVMAYQKVACSIEHSPVEVEQLVRELPGVGEAIEGKITGPVTTGKLDYYEKLKAEFPEGIINLLSVPAIGPRKARLLSERLGIKSVEELEAAIGGGEVPGPPRHGRQDG